MKRCFVLGGSGFIGTRLINALKIRGFNFLAPRSHELDLTSCRSINILQGLYQEGDHLIILAGLNPYRGNDVGILCKNLKIADNITQSINNKIHHITYVSSDAVYSQYERLVSDDTPPSPSTLYGAMHISRELMFNEFSKKLAVVRPTMVLGPEDPHNAYGPNRFLRSSAEKEEIILFGRGEELRDYIEVNELANHLVDISESCRTSAFNLVSGKSFSFHQIAKLIISYRPSTRIIFKPRVSEILHREYTQPKALNFLKNKTNSMDYHIERLLGNGNEGV